MSEAPPPACTRLTQPIITLALVECGLEVFEQTGMDAIRAKSLELTDLFTELVGCFRREDTAFNFENGSFQSIFGTGRALLKPIKRVIGIEDAGLFESIRKRPSPEMTGPAQQCIVRLPHK